MPLKTIEVKPAVKVLDLDCHGKKQYYKSGPNKEKVKYKTKTPAKTKKEIWWKSIELMIDERDIVVIEEQQPRPGNGSAQCAMTMYQYGYLLGLINTKNPIDTVIVRPQKWKSDLGITLDKEEKKGLTPTEHTKRLKRLSYEKAIELYPEWKEQFISERGAIKDGRCEAVLIGHWFLNYGVNG